MTETTPTPESTPAEAPTAPLPPLEAPPVAAAGHTEAPVANAWPAAPTPPHGAHVAHRASDGAIAAMVIGALLFAMLAFGVGWFARGVALRAQLGRGGVMMGRQFGGPGAPGYGYGHGYGGQGYGRGSGRRGMMGSGPNGQVPNGLGAPQGQTPTTQTPLGQ